MALERATYARPSLTCANVGAWSRRVGESQWLALKALGVSPAGAATGADLGGSSKYSSETLED